MVGYVFLRRSRLRLYSRYGDVVNGMVGMIFFTLMLVGWDFLCIFAIVIC